MKEKIVTYQSIRKADKMCDAVKFTQSTWRKKKNYTSEESLKRHLKDQEVFERNAAMVCAIEIISHYKT